MEENNMVMFITKYALSVGILDIECKGLGEFFKPINTSKYKYDIYSNNEAFRTREEAIMDAEKRRERKIASLQKTINKLSRLTFK